ncbi:MAG: carbonic anhydrase [Alphaproteobacteria bacterium]
MLWRRCKLAVVLTCSDWRLHHPRAGLYRQGCRLLRSKGLYVVAVPGPDGLLAPGRDAEWAGAVGSVKLFAGRDLSDELAVVAHQHCLAHAVSDAQHESDVRAVAEALKREVGFEGLVRALIAVRHSDARWRLKELARY